MADTHVIAIMGLEGTDLDVRPGMTLLCFGPTADGWAFAETPDLRQSYAAALATCKHQHAELAAVRTRLFEVEADRARLAIELLSR